MHQSCGAVSATVFCCIISGKRSLSRISDFFQIRALVGLAFTLGDESDSSQQDLLGCTNPEKHTHTSKKQRERWQVLNTWTATLHRSFKQGVTAGMFLQHPARPQRIGADQGGRGECHRQACPRLCRRSLSFPPPLPHPESLRGPQTREAEGQRSGMFYRWRGWVSKARRPLLHLKKLKNRRHKQLLTNECGSGRDL